jgi:hypothetical protein
MVAFVSKSFRQTEMRKAAAVSMESALAEKAKERAHALGFSTFSAYVVQLIRQDLIDRGEMTLKEAPAAEPLPDRREVEYKAEKKKSNQKKKKP